MGEGFVMRNVDNTPLLNPQQPFSDIPELAPGYTPTPPKDIVPGETPTVSGETPTIPPDETSFKSGEIPPTTQGTQLPGGTSVAPAAVVPKVINEAKVAQSKNSMGLSTDSHFAQNFDVEKLGKPIDLSAPTKLKEGTLTLFGNDLKLTNFESTVLNSHNVGIRVEHRTTASGRKSRKQPNAMYVRDRETGESYITFNPSRNATVEEVYQSFYHELGHALDAKGGQTKGVSALRNSGWDVPKKEYDALVYERFLRTSQETINKYKFTEKQTRDWFNGNRINITSNTYIASSRTHVRYLKQESEVFAEAYSMFKMNPTKLKELSPRTYEFIKEITEHD
jgi:hypothetical protein